jgi:hypothetical protein
LTDIGTTFKMLAERGRADEADDTTAAIGALCELGMTLTRHVVALERRVTDLEGRHPSAHEQ